MYIATNGEDFTKYRKHLKDKVAFVPTMGALHQGHMSLIALAQEIADHSLCSVFVNPTQFDNPEDLKKYPRPISEDLKMLTDINCDALYLPTVNDVYPEGTSHLKDYDLGYLDQILEGEYRDGHYQGVANVVYKLLSVTQPDYLIMGAKDYQQVMVVQRMLDIEGLDIEIIKSPIVRENNGLARSSRNVRLSSAQREDARVIYTELSRISMPKTRSDSFQRDRELFILRLKEAGFHTIDYIALADADTLEIMEDYDQSKEMIVLVAAYIGDVRLIDNMRLIFE